MDGDDFNEPISDAARGILDGHIMLSRELANRNHYPAIDVLNKCKQGNAGYTKPNTVSNNDKNAYGSIQRSEDLINIGAYRRGATQKLTRQLKKCRR